MFHKVFWYAVLRSDDQTSTTKSDDELGGNAVTQSSQDEVALTDVNYQELGVHSPFWSYWGPGLLPPIEGQA